VSIKINSQTSLLTPIVFASVMHIISQYWHKRSSLNHCSIQFLIEQLK